MTKYRQLLVFAFLFLAFYMFGQKLIPFEKQGKFGFSDAKTGKLVVEPTYDKVGSYSEGMYAVKLGFVWGYVDDKAKMIVPAKYQEARDFAQGLACVRLCDDNKTAKGCKYGYIDKTGKTAILFEYDDARDFKEGLASVQADKEGPWCYINDQSKCVIRPQFQIANSFQKGTAVVKVNGKFGTIDYMGKALVPAIYDNLTEVYPGIIQANKEAQFGLIRANGKELVPFGKYDKFLRGFDNGLAVVQKMLKQPDIAIALIDTTGRELVPTGTYISIGRYGSNGLAAVAKQVENPKVKGMKLLRYGYIDRKGQEVISCDFEKAEDFAADSAKVRKLGKSFYINKAGICLSNCPNALK